MHNGLSIYQTKFYKTTFLALPCLSSMAQQEVWARGAKLNWSGPTGHRREAP